MLHHFRRSSKTTTAFKSVRIVVYSVKNTHHALDRNRPIMKKLKFFEKISINMNISNYITNKCMLMEHFATQK